MALNFSAALEAWIRVKAGREWSRDVTALRKAEARAWARMLGDRPVSQIGPADVQELYVARDDGIRAGATVNSERSHFRSFWRWATSMEVLWRKFPEEAWPTKRRPLRKRMKRFYSEEAVERLLEHLKPRYRRFVQFAIQTGLRWREIRSILWEWIREVDDGAILSLPASIRKQRVELLVPLSEKALAILGPRGAPHEEVFGNLSRWPGPVGRALKRAALKAGLEGAEEISPHQLRRTFVGRLQRLGYPLAVIKFLAGWSSERVIETNYTPPLSMGEMRQILNKI